MDDVPISINTAIPVGPAIIINIAIAKYPFHVWLECDRTGIGTSHSWIEPVYHDTPT